MYLKDSEVTRFRAEGFLKVPQVLSTAEVAGFLEEAKKLLHHKTTLHWPVEEGMVMDWVADVELESATMRRLALHPVVTGIAEQLAGRPLRLFKSELLRKESAGSTATPLHIDESALPINSAPVTLTAWVALVDVPAERGCMTFWPGSHGLELAETEDLTSHPELRFWPRLTVPLRAGDCTFHHARTAHSAHANETDVTRISLATVYMDAEARFDPRRLYAEGMTDGLSRLLATMKAGDELSGERFPKLR
ncbi:phytanoyl-CoA dioxygenase family protein [Archangium minus]|uniref:Phytanoyl-CoA dioxygenase family protein n=1 Tax=Archangium minus TaxID=83450 RepID=A0ABY9WSS4_9BACT|nr:phytanoyl-CoA dioxygenase family protein [Archangium minus]